MKIRTGFVSNSSSSSFVVAFDKIPQTWEELHQMMFEKETTVSSYGDFMSSTQVAQIVFRDMQGSEYTRYGKQDTIAGAIRVAESQYGEDPCPTEMDKQIQALNDKIVAIVEEFSHNGDITSEFLREKTMPLLAERKTLLEKRDEEILAGADIYYEGNDFKKVYKGKHLFVFSYEDSGSCVMEQGNVFRSLPHIVFNHH